MESKRINCVRKLLTFTFSFEAAIAMLCCAPFAPTGAAGIADSEKTAPRHAAANAESPAEAAVKAQRKTFRERAERSMFGDAPSIAGNASSGLSASAQSSEAALRQGGGDAEVLPEGRMRVRTRLGRFGPEASILLKPVAVSPHRPNRIVRYTSSGIPVSERRDRLVQFSKELAARYREEMQRKVEAGEMPAPPKRKTQAEIWAEKNAEVLERRRKFGRETSENFVIAGTSPEQSRLYYRDSTYITFVNGKAVPVVDAPQEKLPDGWLEKAAYEKALRSPEKDTAAVPPAHKSRKDPSIANAEPALPSNESGALAEPTGKRTNVFSDLSAHEEGGEGGKARKSGSDLIREFFPDAAHQKRPSDAEIIREPGRRADRSSHTPRTSDEANKAIRAAFPDRLSFHSQPTAMPGQKQRGRIRSFFDRVFAFASNAAYAAEPSNMAVSAFDEMAKAIAEDRLRIEKQVNAVGEANDFRKAEKRRADDALEAEAQSCLQCRMTNEDEKDWAAAFAQMTAQGGEARATEQDIPKPERLSPEREAILNAALAVPAEMKMLDDDVSNASNRRLDEIVSWMGDPSHPASIVSALRQGLEENPVVLNYVPDAAARLGVMTAEDDAAQKDPLGTATLVFISFSLGESELLDLFERNADKDDVTLVFRGIPDGMTFAEGVARIQELASQFDPMPNVVIDPTLFRDYGIRAVPTVARIREAPGTVRVRKPGEKQRKAGELIAKATGLHSDVWVKSQIEAGRTGDLGEQGEAREILERDLIEVAKERVLQIDWEEKKARAAKRAWANLQYEHLPTAAETATRLIDPTILVEKDILDLNGNAIRKAGERVNPMDIRPFTLALFVFNPLVEAELKIVEAELPALKRSHPNVMLIATDMVKDETGWDAYVRLTDRLESHVFLLTPEVRERFALRATPSIVTGDNEKKVFVIREIAPQAAPSSEGPKEGAHLQ